MCALRLEKPVQLNVYITRRLLHNNCPMNNGAHIIEIGQENQNGAETRAIRWHHQDLCVCKAHALSFCCQGKKVVYNTLYY